MELEQTNLPEIKILTPSISRDERGFFLESFNARRLAELGLPIDFKQDNHSGSARGVLRGLHYQVRHPQGKLVRVSSGVVFDVAVDLRKSSKSLGSWLGVTLTAENRKMLWIPPGFAHGFYVLSEWAELLYKVTEYYAPEWDRTLRWDDPSVGIEWPLIGNTPPLLSEKDARGALLGDAELFP